MSLRSADEGATREVGSAAHAPLRRTFSIRSSRLTLLAALVFSASCGDTPTEAKPLGAGEISARLNGKPWAVSGVTARQYGTPGRYEIVATPANATDRVVQLVLFNIGGPGTYPLGTISSLTGGAAVVSGTYNTPQNGASGSVTITSRSADRIAGTFRFRTESRTLTTVPNAGVLVTVNDTVIATDGEFNLPIADPVSAPLPDSAGGKYAGTLNGNPFWAAGAIAYVPQTSPGIFQLNVTHEEYELLITINDFTGPGVYATNASGSRRVIISKRLSFLRGDGSFTPLFSGWSTMEQGGPGTITIESVTASRVRGNFSATVSSPVVGGIAFELSTSATFDVKRVNR